MRIGPFTSVFGVDFSGARSAGKTAWLAEIDVARARLVALASLEARSGDARREVALPWLVGAIRASRAALWGIDAPFGLPVELFPRATWRAQLGFVARWDGDAVALGRSLAARSLRELGVMHVRRATDLAMKTPFDCYHYRIIHQTFHAMRDVLAPLARDRATAVLPFQYSRATRAERFVVEACPSSTLFRLGLPRRGYKQPEGGTVTFARARVREQILAAIEARIDVAAHRRVMLADPGGDALDAVLAAVGAMEGASAAKHAAIARDRRAVREGFVFA